MVRISIPTLPASPRAPPSVLTALPLPAASAHVAAFLAAGAGRTLVLTGAGVSVDSGIRAYRGKEGSYSNPNYKPIFYGELVEDSARGAMFRKRYWARSFIGYPPVRDAQPNPTHIYVAALQTLGVAPHLITQNVDNLHPKALALVRSRIPTSSSSSSSPSSSPSSTFPPTSSSSSSTAAPAAATLDTQPDPSILELHGTLARVHCLKHRHEQPRDAYQAQLAALNPAWDAEAREAERTGRRPRTNPDGDVELPGADYTTFHVPPCARCLEAGEGEAAAAVVKPNVVFFGETLRPDVRDASFALIVAASRVLVLGTSLATYSAYRLIKAASDTFKPVLMVSQGPSRADGLPGVAKMEREAGPVLRGVVEGILANSAGPEVDAVRAALDMGVVKRPPEVEGPRAEG
ncbi:hypothetical protein Q5752_000198 [Cryptotrichosporon argae]